MYVITNRKTNHVPRYLNQGQQSSLHTTTRPIHYLALHSLLLGDTVQGLISVFFAVAEDCSLHPSLHL
jgi:hypothetical protein